MAFYFLPSIFFFIPIPQACCIYGYKYVETKEK